MTADGLKAVTDDYHANRDSWLADARQLISEVHEQISQTEDGDEDLTDGGVRGFVSDDNKSGIHCVRIIEKKKQFEWAMGLCRHLK